MPRISVHLVTYNSATTIENCLRSVIGQEDAHFDILVIDNASGDDTVERVRKLGVRVFVNDTNIGYAAAHNQALNLTNSDYVLTLNPDVWLDPQFLQTMTAALDRNPRAGSAAGCLLRVNRLGTEPICVDSTGLLMRRTRHQKLRDEKLPVLNRPAYYSPTFGPDGAAAFYRRAMLNDIRVLDEIFDSDFFMHKEDIDVCWRAQLRGWGSIYVPGAVAHHVRGFRPGQRQQVSALMRYYSVRNRYLLMLKNEIPAHFLRDLWAIALYDIAILIYMIFFERQSLKAFGSIRQLYRRMIAKRRAIQSRRTVQWRDIRKAFNG